MERSTHSRARRRVAAVAAACVVGLAVAGRPPAHLPSAPDCQGGPGLLTSPVYDHDHPGPSTPVAALDALASTGNLGRLGALDAPGVEVEVHDVADPTTDGAATVVVVREGERVTALAHVVAHPAGGFMVDGVRSCGREAS